MSGVYVVSLDPDITGIENIAWAFESETDAHIVVELLKRTCGEAWATYEPVAPSLEDDDLLEYLATRIFVEDSSDPKADAVAIGKEQVKTAIQAIRKEWGA